MADAPIEPQDYLYGVKVVDIGDLRVARGLTRRPLSTCNHMRQVYDDKERRIWCSDCESEIEPFDAFMVMVGQMDSHWKRLQRRAREVAEAEQFTLRSRAAKVMDEAWRSTTMAPLCPHCNEALMPEDVAKGVARASKSLIIARRNKQK
ncbi:hypothetical protein NG726_11825 [Pseudomonas sp. MOB-449]|nr:hypothetical protein [Pseudomonas sp. MOB-449]